jgi:hypothetical protein
MVLMVLEGLHGRVYGVFPTPRGWYWGGATHLADWLANSTGCGECVSVDALAWPILFVGLTWIGALVAFWLRLTWAVQIILVLAIFSLAFWIPGILLTAVILGALWVKPTRIWFSQGHET